MVSSVVRSRKKFISWEAVVVLVDLGILFHLFRHQVHLRLQLVDLDMLPVTILLLCDLPN